VLTLAAGLALVVLVLSELAAQSRGRDAIGDQGNRNVTLVGVLFGPYRSHGVRLAQTPAPDPKQPFKCVIAGARF